MMRKNIKHSLQTGLFFNPQPLDSSASKNYRPFDRMEEDISKSSCPSVLPQMAQSERVKPAPAI